MAKKASAQDAQLVMQLYDLRREAEMRKARSWFNGEFWPANADEFLTVANQFPSQHNNWLRQVSGYWDMAASFVLRGALNEELFLEPGCSGEMFFSFAKVYPFLKELREKMGNPSMYANVERITTGSKKARTQLDRFVKLIEARRKAMAKSA
jgi:hypothetical protein